MYKNLLAGLALLSVLLPASAALAQDNGEPDVMVIVDTSITMKQPGMDAERASLLLTKLLSDIVPGRLAVINSVDLARSQGKVPFRLTGRKVPCGGDNLQGICDEVEFAADVGAAIRAQPVGVIERPSRGDAGFKQQLETHLAQVSHNSIFAFSFFTARSLFDKHEKAGFRSAWRTVIWLSDGADESGPELAKSLAAVREAGAEIVTIIFGKGDPSIAEAEGLTVEQVTSTAELMRSFAQAFRGIVGAPYRVDGLVATQPTFAMREHVEEAWVVVYGDKTLGAVTLSGPGGEVPADYAQDVWPAAGAYRVAHLTNPQAGTWRIRAEGGGTPAYAVVQRSALLPVLLAPTEATAQSQVRLIAALRPRGGSDIITDPEVLAGAVMQAQVEGQELRLTDDGQGADEQAGDGRFSAWHRFDQIGQVPVALRIESPVVRRAGSGTVRVSGRFRYQGGALPLNFGTLKAPTKEPVCVPLRLTAEHQGPVPFVLDRLKRLPAGHHLVLRAGAAELQPNGPAVEIGPDAAMRLCLSADERAPNYSADGRALLRLRVADSDAPDQQVTLLLTWRTEGLTWWQRWGWLVLTLLAVLVLTAIALGFILPKRFARTLALSYAPSLAEVDENPPLALYTWRGVGIGFYRDARAWLHADFRISGKPQGALAGLRAEASGTRVLPGKGLSVYRQGIGREWDEVPLTGEMVRAGEVYRIGDSGPFFRIALRMGGGV